ncbi:aminoglycoside N(3)-acetyltransferase [Streptacidiphilus carbonis]|uniref:aminoglycoside N(3)-acetyltransferase n=1 Tax=Streptacidiphilus carbonis TaxID=105422 RepID=UPI000A7ED74E|nr:AAC(3) family N-acetyltransferase [Streptacidiphilus carbonis]
MAGEPGAGLSGAGLSRAGLSGADLSGPGPGGAGRAGAGPREKHTEADLLADLRALGVRPGGVLLVQSSLRSVGPVVGGADTVVRALRRALGSTGTLVVYTATPENSLSSPLHRTATAGLGPAELADYRDRMPAFDRLRTPSSPTMGRIAETVRTTPGALRSSHPQTSFAALGPDAAWITGPHPLESHLGDGSPLDRLYQADAQSLLVGIPDWLCTPYHLADSRVPAPPMRGYDCVVLDDAGERAWIHFDGVDLSDHHFPRLGASVRRTVPFAEGLFGHAGSWLLPIVPAVDAALACLTAGPTPYS